MTATSVWPPSCQRWQLVTPIQSDVGCLLFEEFVSCNTFHRRTPNSNPVISFDKVSGGDAGR